MSRLKWNAKNGYKKGFRALVIMPLFAQSVGKLYSNPKSFVFNHQKTPILGSILAISTNRIFLGWLKGLKGQLVPLKSVLCTIDAW